MPTATGPLASRWTRSTKCIGILCGGLQKHWRLTGCGDTFQAYVVSHADDFTVLSRGRAAEASAWTKAAAAIADSRSMSSENSAFRAFNAP